MNDELDLCSKRVEINSRIASVSETTEEICQVLSGIFPGKFSSMSDYRSSAHL